MPSSRAPTTTSTTRQNPVPDRLPMKGQLHHRCDEEREGTEDEGDRCRYENGVALDERDGVTSDPLDAIPDCLPVEGQLYRRSNEQDLSGQRG